MNAAPSKTIRVLFYVDPVTYRYDPLLLRHHADWCAWLASNNRSTPIEFHFVSSQAIVDYVSLTYSEHLGDAIMGMTSIDPYLILSDFAHSRIQYTRFLYGKIEPDLGPILQSSLEYIRDKFDPHIVILTSQNRLAGTIFSGRLVLMMEQAPLPRLGRKTMRIMLDPVGSRTESIIHRQKDRILSLIEDKDEANEIIAVWDDAALEASSTFDLEQIQIALSDFRDKKIALLAMQPPDWPSYEGAGVNLAPDNLLSSWLRQLPDGWLGLATFHRDQHWSTALEQSMALQHPNMISLPGEITTAGSEILVGHTDGLVTLTSTSAAFSILSGKPTIVTGDCPFSWASAPIPSKIAAQDPLTINQRASLLSFLCGRYSYSDTELFAEEGFFYTLIDQALKQNDPSEFWFDPESMTQERVRTMLSREEAIPCATDAQDPVASDVNEADAG